MELIDELKNSFKVVIKFGLNILVGFVLYAMVAFSVKFALQLYNYLFKLQDNQTILFINDISTAVSAAFFVLYLFIALIKFGIEQFHEVKNLNKKYQSKK